MSVASLSVGRATVFFSRVSQGKCAGGVLGTTPVDDKSKLVYIDSAIFRTFFVYTSTNLPIKSIQSGKSTTHSRYHPTKSVQSTDQWRSRKQSQPLFENGLEGGSTSQ